MRTHVLITLLLGTLAVATSCKSVESGPEPVAESPSAPEQVDVDGIAHVLKIADWLWSGEQPVGEEDFAKLASLGIKTVLSVDGAQPDVVSARAAGLTYIHIPVGYDAVPQQARAQLMRAYAECERPIYIHCHHGVHRGPAAAAIMLRCDEDCTTGDALEVLRMAGTGEHYDGLWRDVEGFDPTSEKPSASPLAESAEVPTMTAWMAVLDRSWDRLKENDAGRPHEDRVADALIVEEALFESLRFLDEQADPDLHKRLDEAVTTAASYRQAIEADDSSKIGEFTDRIKRQCKGCHNLHRN